MQPLLKRRKGSMERKYSNEEEEQRVERKRSKPIPLRVIMCCPTRQPRLSDVQRKGIKLMLEALVEEHELFKQLEGTGSKEIDDIFSSGYESKPTRATDLHATRLPVEVRYLVGTGLSGSKGSDVVPSATVAFPGGLQFLCDCVADWIARPSAEPLKMQPWLNKAQGTHLFPIRDVNMDMADPGPFHALMFGMLKTQVPSTLNLLSWRDLQPYSREFTWEGPSQGKIRFASPADNRESWIKAGRPQYPVVNEVLRVLAGKRQDITTFWGYNVLVWLKEICEEEIKRWTKLEEIKGHPTQQQLREAIGYSDPMINCTSCGHSPFPPCLYNEEFGTYDPDAAEEDNVEVSLYSFIKLVEANLNRWYERHAWSFPPDADIQMPRELPPKAKFEQRLELLNHLLTKGDVKEGEKDALDQAVFDLFLGEVQHLDLDSKWLGDFDEDFKLSAACELWRYEIFSDLWFHLFDGPRQEEDQIPQIVTEDGLETFRDVVNTPEGPKIVEVPSVATWTLPRGQQGTAWQGLSRLAQRLVEMHPGTVLHAVIWAEDPANPSPRAVIRHSRNKEAYAYLQQRVLYYADDAESITQIFRSTGYDDQLENQKDRLGPQLYKLHPQYKLRGVSYLKKARPDPKTVAVKLPDGQPKRKRDEDEIYAALRIYKLKGAGGTRPLVGNIMSFLAKY